MTDYGRGSGSEPWHPEDPLFGDVYDQGQGRRQPPQQQPYPQQEGGWQDDPYAAGRQQPYPQQGYPQEQYPQEQYPPQQQGYPQQHHPQQPPPQQQPYPRDGYDAYDTGSHRTGGYGQDPYGGQQPADPYGTGSQTFYGRNGYPPQQPQQPQYRGQGMGPGGQQGQGRPGPGQDPGHGMGHPQEPGAGPLRGAPAGTGSWEPEEDKPREHAFFADPDGDHDGEDGDHDDRPSTRSARRAGAGPQKGRKRRSGCACMVVAVVLAGGLGGAAYFGYHFYENHFGPAPDYSGQGSGDVQVRIPTGSTLTTMGNILKKAGVVKSVEAFTAAAGKNPKGRMIQAGIYVLHQQMSAAAAVTMMLDPKSQNAMIVSEGMRDKEIYAAVDQRLGLPAGTTQKTAAAKWRTFGLPSWADSARRIKDPLEGFLFPSRYSVAKGMKPEAVLKEMVGEANQQYSRFDMAAEARKQGLPSPLALLTVASLVQAEGKTDDDFRKMAKVVYNRMVPTNKETYGLLQFDSTYNYIKNIHATNISIGKIKTYDDPYNTYKYKGLPPGPIGNPGVAALKAAMDPDPGNWYYFISLDGKTTKFTETQAEFNRLYNQYNKR